MSAYDELRNYTRRGIPADFEKNLIESLRGHGLTIKQAQTLIDRTYIPPSLDLSDAVERILKSNEGVVPDTPDVIASEESFWTQALESIGLSREDADRLVDEADLRGTNKRENWAKLKRTAKKQGFTLGPNAPGAARDKGWPDLSPELEAENNRWKSILTEHGATPEQADAIMEEAALPGTNRRANRRYVQEAARFQGVKINWNNIPEDEEPAGVASRGAQLASGGRLLSDTVAPAIRGLDNWLANLPEPGGITGVLAILVLLWFTVIKVNRAHTRLELLWLTLTGKTELDIPAARRAELDEPIPDFVAGAEKVVSDTLHGGLGSVPGQGIAIAEETGNALNTAYGFFTHLGADVHNAIVPGGGRYQAGYDARGGGQR